MDEVELNKSRNLEVRELGESVMWILTCPQVTEKTMNHVPEFTLYEEGANGLAIEH